MPLRKTSRTSRLLSWKLFIVFIAFFTSWNVVPHLFELMRTPSFEYSNAPHNNSSHHHHHHNHETLRGSGISNNSASFNNVHHHDKRNTTSPIIPHINNHPIISKNGIVKCDTTGNENCEGFFQYSGPNRDTPNATRILRDAAQAYNYGPEVNQDGHLIFFPNKTRHVECILEWDLARSKFAYRGMSSHSEDFIIFQKFFKNPSFSANYNNGGNHPYFYLEMGAHDGVRESNSRFFDLCLGWDGLLVEPHPWNYDRMVKLRPNAHHLGVAPSCNSSDVVLFPRHKFTNAVVNEKGAALEIHCGPLWYYLDQLDITHIDFFSLDVEGSELNVLKTIDFEKVRIDVILAESINRLKGKAKMGEEVRSFLGREGYLFLESVQVFHSDVFLHKGVCHRYDFVECAPFT